MQSQSTSKVNKKIYSHISKMSQKNFDKNEMILKKNIDDEEQARALTQKESMRIRNQVCSRFSCKTIFVCDVILE